MAQYQNFQVTNPDDYKKFHKGKLEEHHKLLNLHSHNRDKLVAELEKLNQKLPTRKEFVELVHSYLETLRKTRDIVEEDEVYKEMVLNLRVADNTVSVIKLNPPYNLMVDLSKVPSGRDITTDAEPSIELLYRILTSYDDIRFRHERLKRLIATAVKPESITSQEYLV